MKNENEWANETIPKRMQEKWVDKWIHERMRIKGISLMPSFCRSENKGYVIKWLVFDGETSFAKDEFIA